MTLSVAVIGLGFGANHARVLADLAGARLAALCDSDETRLAAAPFEIPKYTDFERMLCCERLDAVVVAVPAALHEAASIAALKAGVAVLVEKPMAPTLAAARHIAEAAASAGIVLMPAHIERFNAALQEVVRRVREGAVGRVLQVNARRLAYFQRARTVDVGVVQDMALHDIDVLRWLTGAEVERVYAETYSGIRTPFEDGLMGLVHFERGGPVATLEVHWLSTRKVRDLSVLGERGLLVASYDDFRNATVEFHPAQDVQTTPSREGGPPQVRGQEPAASVRTVVEPKEPLVEELTAFLAAVRDGTPPPVTPDDGLRALAIVDALTESARTGRPVRPEKV